jgi:hypothetical protein
MLKTMETNNWPDDVRLKMIEKSKFYPDDERVYQYGFYDGYQFASQTPESTPLVTDEMIAELRSLKQSIIESPLKDYFPNKEMSFHDKVVFAISEMREQQKIQMRKELLKYNLWNHKMSGEGEFPIEIVTKNIDEYLNQ